MSKSDEIIKKIDIISAHIGNVIRIGRKIGFALIKDGQYDIGVELISKCFKHDNSKFRSLEWEALFDKNHAKFDQAVNLHRISNSHHPEYWGNVNNMPDVDIAEMAADLLARSAEQSTNAFEYLDNKVCSKFKLTKDNPFYIKIKYYMDLGVEKW